MFLLIDNKWHEFSKWVLIVSTIWKDQLCFLFVTYLKVFSKVQKGQICKSTFKKDMSLLYFYTSSKSGHHHQGFTRSRIRPQIMVKIFATPTWVTLWWEAKIFFFPSNFEKVAESQNGIFIFVPCLSKNCPNASELFDYLCNLL